MPTLPAYTGAILERSIRRGTQTLRGSYDIRSVEPVQVGHERQLLMDFHVVDDLNGCERTVHPPVKYPDNPVIRAEQLYESNGPGSWGTILRDGDTGLFRVWTTIPHLEIMRRPRDSGKPPTGVCGHYYESEDGIEWRRPELGMFDFEGSKANNIFLEPSYNDYVYVLPLPPRLHKRGRYALLYCRMLQSHEVPDPERGHHMTSRIAFSEDGIHWTDAPENPIWVGRTDTNNCIIYNPDRDVFMMYRRATVNAGEIRRIAYSESPDLISWSQPITVVRREEDDPLYFYGMPVSFYHGVYFGYLLHLHCAPDFKNEPLSNGRDFKMDTELVWSRDGVRWERHRRQPTFIPTSPPYSDAVDWGMVRGMANMIEMDDEVRIYYGGYTRLHPPGSARPDSTSGICLATTKRDRLVSVGAGEHGGYMLTKPLAYPGGKLHLNAKTDSRNGFVRVAVREGEGVRDGEWPQNWQFEKSIPFTGDSLDTVITWEKGNDLEAFPSPTLRLHFWMENAELFSFWFA